MVKREFIVLGYVVTFWGVLPGALILLAAWGESAIGPRLALPGFRPAGLALAAISGLMLALSIVQYTRAAGVLPISAFPPQRLIRSGVFGVWRHPIYLFFLLSFGGLAVALWPTGAALVAIPVLAAMTFVYARFEERGLEKRFGRLYRGHRRQTAIVVPRLIHFVRVLSAALGRFFFRLEVLGREHRSLDPPFVVVSAHRCYFDPFLVLAALGRPIHFITTSAMFRKRLPRFLFSRLLGLPVTRYKADVRNALEVRRRLAEGSVVGLFPEAERTWTDTMAGFKPEALRLLSSLPDVPILPVRLEGTYAVWPRWARRPRRAKVTVRFEAPLFTSQTGSPAALEARLAELIRPRGVPIDPRRPMSSRGIETLLYRCPECRRFDAIRSGRKARFECSGCRADFTLLPGFEVLGSKGPARSPLASLARSVRIGPEAGLSDEAFRPAPVRVELAIERDGRLETAGTGRLDLLDDHLIYTSAGPAVRVDLEAIQAVVIEGARKLEVYGGSPARLHQFAVLDQSALKWQDVLVEAVRRRTGVAPART